MTTSHRHPATLAAITATWQLQKSRAHLAHLVQGEALDRAARAEVSTRDGLRSQVLGRRTALGGHADPVAGVADTSSTGEGRPAPMARLADSVDQTIRWLLQLITGCDTNLDRLDAIRTLTPELSPRAAGEVARWLQDLDGRIRTPLGLLPDLLPVPDNRACPACGLRMLRIVTSAPSSADWVIVCTNQECNCLGTNPGDPADQCRCGMPVTEWGQRHIWDRSTPLVDGLLRTMPRRRVRSGRRTVVVDQAEQEAA